RLTRLTHLGGLHREAGIGDVEVRDTHPGSPFAGEPIRAKPLYIYVYVSRVTCARVSRPATAGTRGNGLPDGLARRRRAWWIDEIPLSAAGGPHPGPRVRQRRKGSTAAATNSSARYALEKWNRRIGCNVAISLLPRA